MGGLGADPGDAALAGLAESIARGYAERNLRPAAPAMPPTVPSNRPGMTIMTGNVKTSLRPPLPRMAASVPGSCQIASRTASPTILITAPMTAVATPATIPATNEPERR